MEYISLYLQSPFWGYTGQGSFLCHNAVSSSMDFSNRMTGLHGIWLPAKHREDLRTFRSERAGEVETPLKKPGAGTACGSYRQEQHD